MCPILGTTPGLGVSVPTSPVPLLAKATRVEKEESYSDAQESQHTIAHTCVVNGHSTGELECVCHSQCLSISISATLLQISIFPGVGAFYGKPQYPWVPLATAEQSRLSGPGDISHICFPFQPLLYCVSENSYGRLSKMQ